MDTAVKVALQIVAEIQLLIKQNEDLAKQTDSLLTFVGSLQTALVPLQGFEALPYASQVNLQGNLTLLVSTLETLKRTLTAVKRNGFTLSAAKWIENVQKMEIDLRNILKAIQVNWELLTTLSNESKFSALRLLSNASAKRFWTTHFGAENKYTEWHDFKHTMEEVFAIKDSEELALLEAALCKDGKVSVYSFDTLTRIDGVPSALWKAVYSDKPEKAKIIIEEEFNTVEVLHSKLLAILEAACVKMGKSGSAFIETIPKTIGEEIEKQFPDAGIKRMLMGSVSAKKLQEVATKRATLEINNWLLQDFDREVQACINAMVMALQFALADGFCQRALSLQVIEARINKITTHMTQKGFVQQIIDTVQVMTTATINEKIALFQTVPKSSSASEATQTILLDLILPPQKITEFGERVIKVVKEGIREVLKLMFVTPLRRMLDKSFGEEEKEMRKE